MRQELGLQWLSGLRQEQIHMLEQDMRKRELLLLVRAHKQQELVPLWLMGQEPRLVLEEVL